MIKNRKNISNIGRIIKIVLLIKNIGHEIKDIKVVDRVPNLVKLYERFGAVKPAEIKKNRLTWNFETMEPGEEEVVSYIIYSKIIPVGTIMIPKAVVHYTDIKEKRQVTYSNLLHVTGESMK